ncbi:hypothetical protein D9M68_509300 [compost metagenome]
MEDSNIPEEVLVNNFSRKKLSTFTTFKESYDLNYEAYEPDPKKLKTLSKLLKDKKITVVLGTWCEDSRVYLPRFLKVMDAINIPENQITYIGVDAEKKAKKKLIQPFKIEKVPTFIFSDAKGDEIARITESPEKTFEKDIAKKLKPAK